MESWRISSCSLEMKTVEMKIYPQKSDIHSLESFSTLEDSKEQQASLLNIFYLVSNFVIIKITTTTISDLVNFNQPPGQAHNF